MKCQEVVELIQRHLDHDLQEDETARMFDHMNECPDCSVMFERLKYLSEHLEQLSKSSPSFSLVDAIMPRLDEIDAEQQQQQAVTETPSRFSRRKFFTMLSGVAAACLIMILAFSWNREPASELIASFDQTLENNEMNSMKSMPLEGARSLNISQDTVQSGDPDRPLSRNQEKTDQIKPQSEPELGQPQPGQKQYSSADDTMNQSDSETEEAAGPPIALNDQPDMMGISVFGNDLPSPDGSFVARIEEKGGKQYVVIYDQSEQEVFVSPNEWSEEVYVRFVDWVDESQLRYETVVGEEIVQFDIFVKERKQIQVSEE